MRDARLNENVLVILIEKNDISTSFEIGHAKKRFKGIRAVDSVTNVKYNILSTLKGRK